MKIEIKNVKYAAFASEETNCFSATVYIDGVKCGDASNDGHGGCTFIHPQTLVDRLNAHAATLPKVTASFKLEGEDEFHQYAQDAESLIDDLLQAYLVERDLKKALQKRVLYTVAGKEGIYQSKAAPNAATLQKWLDNPATMASIPADRVLNRLPFDEALALYKAAA